MKIKKPTVNFWIRNRNKPILKIFAQRQIRKRGVQIPNDVFVGNNVTFVHDAFGLVVINNTIIHDNVKIFQDVTLGRKDVITDSPSGGIEIMDGAIICAGAKVLNGTEKLVIGEGSVIAANAVLLNSTGPREIWGGYQLA